MTALTELSLAEAGQGLEASDFTAEELTRACIEALEGGRDLNAFITETPDIAVDRAKASDARRADGKAAGSMDGIPIAVKDLFCTEGVLTTAGSHILDGFTPAYESTVSANLKDSGAVLLGKTNLDEFAMGSANVTSYYGPVKNPWKGPGGKDMVPGGSSGGSAAAVAGGLCPGAIGTDTGGSIRFPSLACGVVGLKPTWGRVSRHGVFPLSETLDHIGPMTRHVGDAAAMLGALAGVDDQDPTSLNANVPDYLGGLADGVRGVKIGVDEQFNSLDVDASVAEALNTVINVLRGEGAEIVPISVPPHDAVVDSWLPICAAEAALAHHETYPARADEYGPVTGDLLAAGVAFSAADYARATIIRRNFSGQLARLFDDVDLIAAPAMVVPPPRLDEMDDLLGAPGALERLIRFTSPFDHSGSPTLSLPCGFTDAGAPLGFQLIGRHLDEGLLLRAGHAFERATVWNARHPDL